MKTDNVTSVLFLLAQLVTLPTAFAADMQPRVPMPGAPNASDVIMRSLRLRPSNRDDKRDTMQALRDFHTTTLAWAYIDDPSFIAKVKQSGRVFGGAASAPSYVGSKDGDDWLSNLAIPDRRGKVIIAPWKRTWKPTLWGCLNNPELQRGYLAYLKRYVDAGAQIMQRDEPGGNKSAVSWGGCFCEHCMRGFRNYLANHTTPEQREQLGIVRLEEFDYRTHLDSVGAPVGDAFGNWDGGRLKELFLAFQTKTTVEFHRRARAALDAHAGRRVPFSCNNGVRHWSEIELGFDWAFGELSYRHATAHYLYQAMRTAAAHDRAQIVTMPKKGDRLFMDKWSRLTRQTIAMAYACGGHCMVPWDVYMPRDAPRYFGTPEQYADLFGFIRANGRYFDGYEQAEAIGHGVPVAQQAIAGSVHLVGGESVHVNVRAQPGQRGAPVVIQLVDWADNPQPFSLVLIESFANNQLAGSPFTIFMVTQSDSPDFGICGNGPTGGGGVPRLYLTRRSYRYDDLYKGLEPNVPGHDAAISVFAHDGEETIAAWVNGASKGQTTGLKAVAEFGGGHLAMPFRAGNRGQAGEIAEIIVYTRRLSDTQRRGIEAWLADQYLIPVRRWH